MSKHRNLRHVILLASPLKHCADCAAENEYLHVMTKDDEDYSKMITWDHLSITIDCDGFDPGHVLRSESLDWPRVTKMLSDLLTAGLGNQFSHILAFSLTDQASVKTSISAPPSLNSHPWDFRHSAFPAEIATVLHIADSLFSLRFDDNKEYEAVIKASSFYRLAIENMQISPALAYSLLISSLECLTYTFEIDKEMTYDAPTKAFLHRLVAHEDFGEKDAKFIKSRLWQIKKSVIHAAKKYCSPSLYSSQEGSKHERTRLLAPRDEPFTSIDELETSVGKAYDLRSKHLHAGFDHSSWTAGNYKSSNEPKYVRKAPSLETLVFITQSCVSTALKSLIDQPNP